MASIPLGDGSNEDCIRWSCEKYANSGGSVIPNGWCLGAHGRIGRISFGTQFWGLRIPSKMIQLQND